MYDTYVCMYIYIRMYVFMYVCRSRKDAMPTELYVCMSGSLLTLYSVSFDTILGLFRGRTRCPPNYLHTHTHTHAHARAHTHTHTHTYIYIYSDTHTHTHTHVCVCGFYKLKCALPLSLSLPPPRSNRCQRLTQLLPAKFAMEFATIPFHRDGNTLIAINTHM